MNIKNLIIIPLLSIFFIGCQHNHECDVDIQTVAIYTPKSENILINGKTHWDIVKGTRSKFKGHYAPVKHTLGYIDTTAENIVKEIDIANNNGIDAFLFEWSFQYGKSPKLTALENSFFKAKNSSRMKFAILLDGNETLTQIDLANSITYCKKKYFAKQNYLTVAGTPLFAISNIEALIKNIGGEDKLKLTLSKFSKEIKFLALVNSVSALEKIKNLEFAYISANSLIPEKVENKVISYQAYANEQRKAWEVFATIKTPVIPFVCAGYDTSATSKDYIIAKDNTPDLFHALLKDAKSFLASTVNSPKLVLIDAWNNTINGAYVMPDHDAADQRLRFIANEFGRNPANLYQYTNTATKETITVPAPDIDSLKYDEHFKTRIDVWLPKNATSKTPAILYFHGGGWTVGARGDKIIGTVIPKFLEQNVAVISAGYRFIKDAQNAGVFPPVGMTLSDCLNAVKFVMENADKWNIDKTKITLSGGSAGAFSALYCGLANNNELGVYGVSPVIAQTSIDPKQMREWIPNVKYGYHVFNCKNFEDFLSKREKLLPYIEKYSPAKLIEKIDSKKAPKFVMQYPMKESPNELPLDPTHSARFGENFKKLCDKKSIKCEVSYGEYFTRW